MLEFIKDSLKGLLADSRYCHIYRPQPGIVEIRSGIRYGRGKLLATGTEAQPGEAVPTLLAAHADAIGTRKLIATLDDLLQRPLRPGDPIPGALDPWHPALLEPGEIWHAGNRAAVEGFPLNLYPS